jgi:hypothetical protein
MVDKIRLLLFEYLIFIFYGRTWSFHYLVILFLQIIVLEDTKEYISYASKEETKAQDRRPFDLLVCQILPARLKFN